MMWIYVYHMLCTDTLLSHKESKVSVHNICFVQILYFLIKKAQLNLNSGIIVNVWSLSIMKLNKMKNDRLILNNLELHCNLKYV